MGEAVGLAHHEIVKGETAAGTERLRRAPLAQAEAIRLGAAGRRLQRRPETGLRRLDVRSGAEFQRRRRVKADLSQGRGYIIQEMSPHPVEEEKVGPDQRQAAGAFRPGLQRLDPGLEISGRQTRGQAAPGQDPESFRAIALTGRGGGYGFDERLGHENQNLPAAEGAKNRLEQPGTRPGRPVSRAPD